jgi:hypothetical protein
MLNAPKLPIGTKNHETIFIKYYRKSGVQQNWFGIFSIFLQFSRNFLSPEEKEKEKGATGLGLNWPESAHVLAKARPRCRSCEKVLSVLNNLNRI